MAEGGSDGDLDSLTDAQKDLLHNFQEFTAINDIETCITKLESHDWDLESAINDTFGLTDRVIPSSSSNNGSNDTDVVVGPLTSNTNSPRIRAVAPSFELHRQLTWMEWLRGWLFAPYRFTVSVIVDILNFVGSLFWFRFGRGQTDPVEDVLNFKNNFEEMYGNTHPTFYQGSYNQALSDARKELRFLLVYLHSEDHQDTNEFCRTVLSNDGFTNYVNGNMLFWACDVNTNEGYKVSRSMRESTYPFLAVVCLRDNRMTIVWRMNGFLQLDELIAMLARCIDDNEAALVVAREEKAKRNDIQILREKQDAAYKKSLLMDQKKAKQRQQEENERLRVEQEKEEKRLKKERELEDIARRREECRCKLEELGEPDADDHSAVHVRIRLPNGTLLNRRFHGTDKVQLLYDFAFADEEAPASFLITSNFPRQTFPPETKGESTLDEVGIAGRGTLFVQSNCEDTSDEESS